jgi:hypothetical protein
MTTKHFIAVNLDAQHFQAVKKLEKMKAPLRKSCTSDIIRECIEWAYWLLQQKYSGVPMTKPNPLPEVIEDTTAV